MRMWPGLRRLMGDFTVPGFVKIRPVDLYVTKGYRQDGVVLVGDAFATSCPAAGTGARKVLVDVERLCNVHIPRWLATPGMGEAKIAAFYDDPVKQACDALSAREGLRAALVLDRSRAALGRDALGQVRGELGQGHAAAPDGSAAPATAIDDDDARRSADLGAEHAGAQIARFGDRLFLNAEADHRPVIDAVGVVRRGAGRCSSRRALEIVGAIAERQLRRACRTSMTGRAGHRR